MSAFRVRRKLVGSAEEPVNARVKYIGYFAEGLRCHGVDAVFICGVSPSVYIQHIGYLLLGQIVVLAKISYSRVLQLNHLKLIINAINSAINFWQDLWHNVIDI